jgi:HlyD family secretion protein
VKKRLIKLLKTSVKLALVVAMGVGGWYAYGYYVPVEEEDGLGALPTAVAEVRDITVSVQANGVLRPVKVIEIKSKASGEILDMPVEVGDFVEAGDLIAQIDTNILDQELRQVQADYDSAVIRLDIAKNQYERAQILVAQDLISENDLDSSQQAYTNAEAQMLRGEASLDLAKERLADATVRAPSRGTVINKTVEEGQIIASSTNTVSGGTTLLQMADLSQLEIRTLVDEVDIGQVRGGLAVESTVEAFPALRFHGTVVKIEPQAEVQQSVTAFPVLSRIENADGKLLPGMNADVSIVVHRQPGVLAIPNEAVRTPSDAGEVMRMLGVVADGGGDDGGGRGGFGGEGRGSGGPEQGGRGAPGERGGSGAPDRGQGDQTRGGSGGRGELTAGRGDSASRGGGNRGGSSDRGDRTSSGERGFGGGGSGGSSSGADVRARFENASPAERQRLIAAMRADREPDRDPFGISGRREDAVVFLYDELGRITTKNIVVGVRDWEHTEVLEGIEPGEEIVILPSTALLRTQDRLRSWAQGRSGIPGLGSSGGGGRPPGGGGRGRGGR